MRNLCTRLLHAMTALSSNSDRMNPKASIPWTLRPSTADDSRAANELLQLSYSSLLPKDYDRSITDKALPVITTAQPELLMCGTWYLVHHPETNELVGCGGWSYHVHKKAQDSLTDCATERKVPHLRHFATHPDWLRTGIGRAIWDQTVLDLAGCADESKLPTVEVFSSITGEAFYASLGFKPVKNVLLPIKNDCMFPCILMQRPAG
jgi:GNAT superfamily N-acetyltransferase